MLKKYTIVLLQVLIHSASYKPETLYLCSTYEGSTRGDTFRFDSFISHSTEHIEVTKNLKGFLPNALPSKCMIV